MSTLRPLVRAPVLSIVVASALGALGCGGPAIRHFPLRAPIDRDSDLSHVSIACREKPTKDDPHHRVCRPDEYVSSFAWDAADNTVFRPLSRFWAVDPGGEATNANALDEVADSAWFTNRLGQHEMSVEEIAAGPCKKPLDPNSPDGSWLIDKGKSDGATPGFRIKLPDKRKYMLKGDFDEQPERPSAASAMGVRFYWAAGFWVSCDDVVYFKPSLLKLSPGLTVTTNEGVTYDFDQKRLDDIVEKSPHRGDTIRMQSSQWLDGLPIGPFKYDGTKDDDPNDVVAHEDRRELRGAKLLAAWINHFDAREQNTMNVWFSDDPKNPDASPGYVRHYYLDVSDSFGSVWAWDGISRRLGYSYYLDFPHVAQDFITFGLLDRRWNTVQKPTGGGELFGYFRGDDFDPETWHPGYPNPAFSRMSERDGAWMARIIARFSPDAVAAIVKVGDFTKPENEAYILNVVLERQRRIVRRYLGRLSPVTDVKVVGTQVCGLDLARKSGVFADKTFAYRAHLLDDDAKPTRELGVTAQPDGRVCVDLAATAPDGGWRDDDPKRYRVVGLSNGVAPGLLRAHLYDLGPTRGLVLVGLERMDP